MQTVTKQNAAPSGAVFYDAECPFCIGAAHRFEGVLARRGLTLEPLQSPGASVRLKVPETELLIEMRLRSSDGAVFGGAAAVVEIARRIWWASPVWLLSRLPGAMRLLDASYRHIARRRGCVNGACAIPPRPRLGATAFLPLMGLPVLAAVVSPQLSRWGFMWTMAFALYAGCKWLTYCDARARGSSASRGRTLGYLLGWPGMEAIAFLGDTPPTQPRRLEWAQAVGRTLLGAAILLFIARNPWASRPLLTGWIGMVGAILLLHFGTFHLLSLVWRKAGVDATPLMQAPLRSSSLAEFWGRRWNTAFHELATRYTFRPLRRMFRPAGAALLVFLVSGLIHELVISIPAGGGYGLPTAYFLVQGLGVAGERSRLGRTLGLGHGWRGWLFTALVAAGPAYWLFPPPFIHNVILPMLAAIAVLGGTI